MFTLSCVAFSLAARLAFIPLNFVRWPFLCYCLPFCTFVVIAVLLLCCCYCCCCFLTKWMCVGQMQLFTISPLKEPKFPSFFVFTILNY
ncbi:MAG: hypothetical protein J3R72DRAFT_449228 [Linnemannia gamsii]|nr:MAG: hypothetical protein J3R72DRAFT_449228 [Linnemannia gamsii]